MDIKKAVFVLFLLLISFGCGQSGRDRKQTEQILRLNIHTEPPTLDPRKAIDIVSIFVIKQCQEGLMQRGHDGLPKPGLAERFEKSEDGLIYTFYLRDLIWSDGKPLTAYDFERSWKTLLSPEFPSEQAFELYLLKNGRAAKEKEVSLDEVGVKALDAKRLRIELEHPAPYFLSLITTHPFFPIPDPFDPYISSGPFQLKQWKHFDELTLKRNPSYWEATKVKLETVRLFIVEDDQTELNLFENGELDWAGHPFSNLPTDALPELQKRHEVKYLPLDATYLYVFNTTVYPFNNVNFRKALSLAIDREAIVTNIAQTQQIPTLSLVPSSLWGEKEIPYPKRDLAEAQRLFQQALSELGTSLEKLPPITLSYNTMVGHHKIAQAIQHQWTSAFGIKVHLQNKEWKVFLDDMNHGNFQVARGGYSANIDDPITFLDLFLYPKSNRNCSHWSSPEFVRLLKLAEQTNDAKKRLDILKKAEELLLSEMPIAPIFTYRGSFIHKPYVKNVYISRLGDMDIRNATISYDEDLSP